MIGFYTIKEGSELEYEKWLENTKDDPDIHKQLMQIYGNDEEVIDSFYTELTFGTSGLRGLMGPGTNRINKYVIRRAAQGVCNYLKKNYKRASVVVGYDSRKDSELFAQETAAVLRGNGVQVNLFRELAPVSLLSYAIRYLNCTLGIMITASHNPRMYNGFKVYNAEGHQIVGEVPDLIMKEIDRLDYFDKKIQYRQDRGIMDVTNQVRDSFMKDMKATLPPADPAILNTLKTVYTPLNGAGSKYVKAAFLIAGYKNYTVVSSQDSPDPDFPTCPQPNPEKIMAYDEGFRVLDEEKADIILATDPDADRCGCALYHDGMRTVVTGNQLGILMLDYLCHLYPPKPGQLVFKSIATTPLVGAMADRFGFKVVNTLTGFKYIGELLAALENAGKKDSFYFAFEESNGFLCGPFIREKDGISAAVLIAEMAAFHKLQGKDLIDRLNELYDEFGRCVDKQRNYFFNGAEGADKIQLIMKSFRTLKEGKVMGGRKIVRAIDYLDSEATGLPPSDVLQFDFEDRSRLIIRPSGTEAKLKVYTFETSDFTDVERDIVKVMEMYR